MGETGLEIAVIGMSARFPGAASIGEFWENLKNSVEVIYFLNEKELEHAGVDPEQLDDPHYVKAVGGILEEVEYFDAAFFDYVPNEAVVMDPQLRLFHEYAWEALENAGYDPHTYTKKIGLYAGASSSCVWESLTAMSAKAGEVGRFASATLANSNLLATRVSYKLNLKGPAFNVQTACSTSLVAIALACQGILTGQCNMALAGGVSVTIGKKRGYIYKEGMIRPPDGHCRAFAAEAKGMIAGEGIGIVLLKLLEDALEEGDTIHAVIRGSAVNNDGNRKVGYTAPSIDGQVEVIRAAYLMAEVEPESITYIETHGTGTVLGDPVEIEALKQAFAVDKKGFCAIGSVKTNIGHLDAASGAASFIKTVLALKHRQIPPTLHVEHHNPKIDFQNSPFYVNTTLIEWKNENFPLRAGVSSFGIGGTNAHIVLEEAPGFRGQRTDDRGQSQGRGGVSPPHQSRDYQLILLSAKTPSALEKKTGDLAGYFQKNPGINLADVAYTLHLGRKAFQYRRFLVCSRAEEAVEVLMSKDSREMSTYFSDPDHQRIIFVFPGIGAQYVNMGRELYEKVARFRREMDRCFKILKGLIADDIKKILYPDYRSNRSYPSYNSHQSQINQTEIAQPLIFIIEYALAQLLIKWGIKPYGMIGYSFGEYAAACTAGVFSLEDALKLVVTRGQLMKKVPGSVMVSVPLSREKLSPLLPGELSLAIDNGSSCIVGGTEEAVAAFEKEMKNRRCLTMRVPQSHAVHSHMMRPILKEFQHHLSQLQFKPPQIPYISNVTGDWIKNHEPVNAEYWAQHLGQTVRFADGIKQLAIIPGAVFIEVGPGRNLVPLVTRHANTNNNSQDNHPQLKMINLVRNQNNTLSDLYYLLNKIGHLWLYGTTINGVEFYAGQIRSRIPIPTYPFERQRYWLEESEINNEKFLQGGPGGAVFSKSAPSGRRRQEPLADWFYLPNWKRALKILNKHIPPGVNKRKWLIFLDQCGLGDLLAKKLEDRGHEVVTVTAGPGFTHPGQDQYFINPRHPGDYQQLFNHINRQSDLAVSESNSLYILHLWTLTGNRSDGIEFEQMQTLGFYSLLNITRFPGKGTNDTPGQIRLTVISDHMQDVTGEEVLAPVKSTILGPLAVIPQEHTHIRCRAIDIVLPGPGTRAQDLLVNQVLAEINDNDETWESTLAFRGPHRLVPCFEPLHLEKVDPGHLPLQEKGVYLITGGTGNIGLTLAEYLAKEFNARLILTGRTPVSSKSGTPGNEKFKKIKELEAWGAEVMTISCNIEDEPGMKSVISAAEQRWGRIHGVIHAAGLISGSTIDLVNNLDPDVCQRQFQAKVSGTLVLERLFREKSLDFCWLMSSISTVLGGLRFSAYAAANAFMDALACQLRTNSPGHWLSVDWDGMSKENTIEGFKRILALVHANNTINRVVVSTGGNLQARINQWIKLELLSPGTTPTKDKELPLYPRPQLFNPYVAPVNHLQERIAGTWKQVLGFEQIGIRDDFLELGGDSLKAITLISALHQQFNIEIPLPVFFDNPTVEKLAEYMESTTGINSYASISPVETIEYYPLSSAQKRIYFLQQMDLSGTTYNMPLVFPLSHDMEKDRIELTLKKLIARHESLRTFFLLLGEEPVQRIHPEVEFAIEYFDMKEVEVKVEVKDGDSDTEGTRGFAPLPIEPPTRLINSFIRPFDLSQAPLIRSGLIRLPDNNYTWMLDLHHIISDGTSWTILTEDFRTLYDEDALPPLVIQYKDFAQWQNRLFASSKIKEQEEYWLKLYQGEIPRINLPTDYKRPEVFTFAGDSYSFTLDPADAKGFKALAAAAGGTLYMNLLAALNILFYLYTGQTDIIIGSGTAGRNHAGLERVVGMFINTLAMRCSPQPDKTYQSFLKEVIAHSIQAFANQDIQFEELIERLDPVRDPSRNPLFDISMVVQNFRKPHKKNTPKNENTQVEILPESDEKLPALEYKDSHSKFDMTFFVREPGEDVQITVEYYTGIFKLFFIQHLASHLKNVIKTVVKNPAVKLKDIDILSREEKEQVLYGFNDTSADYPDTAALHELFARQVERTPAYVALHGGTDAGMRGGVYITYYELNQRANQVANYLGYKKETSPEEPVGLLMSQSLNQVIAILGVLKSGGCYVPIDPSLPQERIKYIIDDAGIGTVISVKKHIRTLNRLQWECIDFHSYLCMDSHDIHSEDEQERSELMDVELWHHVGKTASDDITGGGWISSFTGEPFSRQEMDEYGDNILEKLLPRLHPRMHVLEIGCATGITMYRIAPKVELYYGTDLSQIIIDKNKKIIEQKGHQNVILKTLPAHEIHQLETGKNNFHLIIINSVIQCFPGHNYLRKVIVQCMDLAAEQAYLFIGDVMDQQKKQTLVQELVEFKRNNRDKGYTTKTDFSAELFVSREFWEDIGIEFNQVEAIEISDKIFTIKNELSQYRYDVLITINKRAPAPKVRERHKHQDDLRCLWSMIPEEMNSNQSPGNLAYIIYTSGTTGMPKGVAVEHRSVVNLCYWHHRAYHITEFDRATLYAAVGFDASVWELFPYLLKGSILHLVDDSIKLDIEILQQFFQRHVITMSFLPTQLCELFITKMTNHPALRALLTGGDKLHRFTKTTYQLYNNYGPTENTVVTTAYPVNNLLDNIPIGKPIDNCRIYILDKEGRRLQPVGIAGELCMSGKGLARGYLNNPEITAEKFDQDLWDYWDYHDFERKKRKKLPGKGIHRSYRSRMSYISKKIYRSGDLARWIPNGNIEFLGRTDFQVKIRGFRIELGEIESQLIKHHDIKKAVVINRENETGDNYLCAYIVPESNGSIDSTLLGEYLAETLPDYMIPSFFVPLEEIPLTPNGKIHRKALPEPVLTTSEGYAAPINEIEKRLTAIWSEILGVQKTVISRHDNFFDLGGHSLKATTLSARIHKEMNIKIPLAEIFKTPSIRGMSAYLNQASKERYGAIEPGEKKEFYVQSSAQKRMYILQQMEPGTINYNMPESFLFTGHDDKEKLQFILKRLTARHESLRTSFHMIEDQPVQRIHDQVSPVISEEHSRETILQDFVRPFDLTRAPLMRVGLVETGHQKYLLLIDMHHIITDGVSHRILTAEFSSLLNGQDLLALRLRYRDYTQWQHSAEQQFLMKQQEAYWLKELSGELPVLELPTDYPRPAIQSFAGDTTGFLLHAPVVQSLKKLGENTNATLFMTVLAVLQILLAKLSGQEDIIVGIPIAGRRHDDLKKIIGMFVNTLALRTCPAGEKTFIEFLQETKNRTLEVLENQEYQFEDLVEKVQVRRDTGRNPVFDVLFNFLDQETLNYTGSVPGIKDQPLYQYKKNTAKFDLTLAAIDRQEDLLCSFEYCTRLFKSKTIDRMIGYFKKMVETLAKHPRQKIGEIEIITPLEKQQILETFNDIASEYPRHKTIRRLIAEQAVRTPERIVMIGTGHRNQVHPNLIKKNEMKGGYAPDCARLSPGEQHLSYTELMQKANQLSHHLRTKGVKPDTIVGIMMERSVEMIIGILGILNAGGAYLPIDPDYPEARIKYTVKDSNVRVLVTTSKLQVKVKVEENFRTPPQLSLQLINLETGLESAVEPSISTSTCQVSPANLAYVIYTSGTTGKPKGVLIRHLSLVRLMVNDKFPFDFNENDIWTLFHSTCFDFSVWEMYGAMVYGGKLVIVPKTVARDTEKFLELLKEKQVTVLNQTPPAFYQLAHQELKQPGKELNIRYIIFGGEALAPARLRQWKQKYPATKLINMYGITETTVHSTLKEITKDEIETNTSNIGKPIPTLKVYLIDRYLKPVPIGVAGELWAAGPGTARGYLNRPELTAERFIKAVIRHSSLVIGSSKKFSKFTNDQCSMTNARSFHSPIPPFAHLPIYRSGDLARWLPDGNIEFLGRIDQQVKIRGFRVEPGEIEHRLQGHPQVKEALVITRRQPGKDTDEKYLCAYIVLKANPEPKTAQLREYLTAQLPAQMVPDYFVLLQKIPLNPNGKIDRSALPEPVFKPGENYAAPKTELEKKLIEIWAEVLGIKGDIGIHDNFFELGGHSLKATVLANKILQTLQVRIPLVEIFHIPTLRQMADWIANAQKDQFTEIEKVKKKDYYELSYHQKRLWILNQLDPESSAFHMPGTLVIHHEVDKKTIKKALQYVVRRHESLRTGFTLLGDEPMQFILPDAAPPIQIIDLSAMSKEEKQEKIEKIYKEIKVKPFQLHQPPLFRSALVKSGPGHYEFIFNIHHIVSDGWSMEILKRDFSHAYEGFRTGKTIELTALEVQYKDFAAMHNQQLKDPAFQEEAQTFWKEKLHGIIPTLKFHGSLDKNMNDQKGAGYQCFIDAQLKEKLQETAKGNNTSLFMVMFSVYILFLTRFTGEQDIACSFISAGREHASLHDIIGFFVNSVIFKTRIDERESFEAFLQRVKKDILEIFSYQGYPLELLFEELQMRYPDIPVSFNLVNLQDAPVTREQPLQQPVHVEKSQDVKFDLEPYINEYKNGIHIYWAYKKSLFTPKTIEYMASEYIKLLDYFSSHLKSHYKAYRDRGSKPTFKKRG